MQYVAVMWNKVQCRICAIWCNATCDVMQCQMVLWNVVRRGMMVVHVEYGCVLWCNMRNVVVEYTEWCGMVRHFIRHGDVMQNDSLNAVCSVVWNVIRVLWDSAMCNIPECGDVCMAWGGMWARCGMVCRDVVEWFDVNYGAMWNVVRCGMLQFQTWCEVECGWNAKCVMWNMACCGMWCPGTQNVA